MTKINGNKDKISWAYRAGFFIILALPVLVIPPYLFPPDWGKTIVFRSIMAVLLFLSVSQLLSGKYRIKTKETKKNILLWILAALAGIFILASIFSVDPYFSFWGSPYRSGGSITFIFYLIFAAIAYALFKKEDWKKALDFSIIIGILVSFIGIIQYFGLFNNIFVGTGERPPSTMGNPDILGLYLLLLFFVTLTYTIKETVSWKKILYILSSILFIYVILITGSRAAYLGLLIGGIYFLFFYPKKLKAVKITAASLLVIAFGLVLYINIANQYPKFLQQNKLFNSVSSRLLIRPILNDPRFYAWTRIDYKILTEKPILGYGPENFSVGFDKYYDPSVPYLSEVGGWWDRAHNIIIQTGSDAGFLGIIAYLALFITLLYQLQKIKKSGEPLIPHGIQATLIGYFIANLFSFDSFSTYFIFFLLIAYSMHIIYNAPLAQEQNGTQKNTFWKSTSICALFIILVVFLWQYNLVPFQINSQINIAENLANQKQCDQAFSIMDRALQQHSFLDSYARAQDILFEKTCSGYYSQNILAYTQKGVKLLNEAVKIQPLYTRYWLYLGTLTTTLAEQEPNSIIANNLAQQGYNYFNKALQLAPKHQEILTGLAKLEIDAGDYKNAKSTSEKCVTINSALGDCYWYLGLSEIYLDDNTSAQKDLQVAGNKKFSIDSESSLDDLVNAYGQTKDYHDLAPVLEKLVAMDPNNSQYKSFLSTVYQKLGR